MAHPDLDELLNALLPFAQQTLDRYGEFLPFGASIDSLGEIRLAAGHTEDERPPSQEVIDLLVEGFRQAAGRNELRAAGICLDVRVVDPNGEKTDAVCARLEHESGETIEVYLPYRKPRRGKIKYGDIFAAAGSRAIFGSGDAK